MEDSELREILFIHMDEQAMGMDCLSKMTAVSKIVNSVIDDISKELEFGRRVSRAIEDKLKTIKNQSKRQKARVA